MKNRQARLSQLKAEIFPGKTESTPKIENKFNEKEVEVSENITPAVEKRDFSDVFARMKKSMRKKSSGIF